MPIVRDFLVWVHTRRGGVQVVVGAVFIVAVALTFAAGFRAFGATVPDALNTAVVVTALLWTSVVARPAQPAPPPRRGLWLAEQSRGVRLMIGWAVAVVFAAGLFGVDLLVGSSKGWALGAGIFAAAFVGVTSSRRLGASAMDAPAPTRVAG